MGDVELESINEEFLDFAIQESIQQPCSNRANRIGPNTEDYLNALAAIEQGDVHTLQGLSGSVSAFRERDSRGWLLLHRAAALPRPGVLELVLRVVTTSDLTLEEQTDDGETALTLAAEACLVENAKVLLDHGASPHNTNHRNETPLLIAVRESCYNMALAFIMGGAFVEQVCLTRWTATHEAAKVGCPAILMLLLRHGGKVSSTDSHGVTPLGIAAEYGHAEVLDILIKHGADVNAQASNGDTVLYDAAGSGNLDCVELLLQHGANPNIASYACQLPIHRAAYEGYYLILRTLIPLTTKRAIRLSGLNPIHSAADGGHTVCLELLIQKGFNVNALLDTHISENYGDLRKTPLYFAVSNGDITCAEMLLAAGAKTDLDPLLCILVAIRAERYELVRLLLSYGAEVNCYFREISDTTFPTALQYSLKNPVMLRLLLNSGYDAHKCFQCHHGNSDELDASWADLHNQAYEIYSQPDTISFCEFVSVSWLMPLVGSVVRTLLDYVSYISLCPKLERVLERRPQWTEISDILGQPRSLQHLCRLVIRSRMRPKTLNNPEAMARVPFPPRLKEYLTYREYDLYGDPPPL